MKIGYVTTYDARDAKNWSTLGYYIRRTAKELSERFYYIESLKEKYSIPYKFETVVKKCIFNKNYSKYREPVILRVYAHQARQKLSNIEIDIIFSPGSYNEPHNSDIMLRYR